MLIIFNNSQVKKSQKLFTRNKWNNKTYEESQKIETIKKTIMVIKYLINIDLLLI